MTDNHPLTPPPELVRQWITEERERGLTADHGFTQAAQWGADQELEACCEWNNDYRNGLGRQLRAARRPEPPSLKEQALVELDNMIKAAKDFGFGGTNPIAIRRALEQLPDNE